MRTGSENWKRKHEQFMKPMKNLVRLNLAEGLLGETGSESVRYCRYQMILDKLEVREEDTVCYRGNRKSKVL